MAIAFVQSATKTVLGTSTPQTLSFTSTAGNLLVISASDDSGSTLTSTGISATGFTFTQILYNHPGNSLTSWYSQNIPGGTNTISFTENQTNGTNAAFVIQEFSGIASVALDQSATGSNGVSTTTPSGGTTATTTQADELVVCFFSMAGATTTFTAGAGYSNAASIFAGTSAFAGIESKIVSATGAQTGSATLGAARTSIGHIATFKAAVASDPSPQPYQGNPPNPVLRSFSW